MFRLYMDNCTGKGYIMIYNGEELNMLFGILDYFQLEKPDYVTKWIVKQTIENTDYTFCLFGSQPEKYMKYRNKILGERKIKRKMLEKVS